MTPALRLPALRATASVAQLLSQLCLLLLLFLLLPSTLDSQAPDLAPLERAAAVRPDDVEARRRLAQAYAAAGRPVDAVREWRRVTELAPGVPGGWYSLGHAYNAVARDAMRALEDAREDSWRQLIVADTLLANGHLTDAFSLYREVLQALPAMVTIHDAVADIYERAGHDAWATTERARGALPARECAARQALCEFRAGRHEAALQAALAGTGPEARYWQARAATELALAAFHQLEKLPDSMERRAVRAALARGEDRHLEALAELEAGLALAPDDPSLLYELASTHYATRNYDATIATLGPLLKRYPDDPRILKLQGYALLQLRRIEDALPVLQRAAAADTQDPGPRLALGRAHLQRGDFAAAVPLIEPQLAADRDGSLHVQLARAYAALGQREKAAALLTRSEELRRETETRHAAAGQRTITPPK